MNIKYLVFNIGCIECGVSSNVVGIFEDKNRAEEIVEQCDKHYYWRYGGDNQFEIFELPELNIINKEYPKVK